MYLRNYSFIFLLLTALLATACQKKVSEHHDSFLIFGTIVNVTLLDIDEALAEETFRHIRDDFKLMHRAWHVWEPGPLMRTNQLLKTKLEFSAAPSVLELFRVAKELSIKSQNLFNPAVGELIALWGFHSHQQPSIEPEDKAILALLKQHPTMQDITVKGVRMKSSNAAVKLDFGGVAKGFAIDLILKDLKQKGIQNALIDTGGDLKVIGQHGNRAWKVAIRDPRHELSNGKGIVTSIELNDNEAAFTSGDYERYLKNNKPNIAPKKSDKHLHHIIDPRTGYPATGTQSVTILHNNASTADAAATAIFIAGPTQWQEIAKAMGIKNVLLIDSMGKIHISSAMQKRVKLQPGWQIIEQADL
jgi:thiamine biosynthesis lipoprotein